MKTLILFIILSFPAEDVNKIAYINRLKKEAEQAYVNNNYPQAIEKYSILVDSLGLKDEKILLNLSNAYYHLRDTSNAGYLYTQLTEAENREIQSRAYQQLGVMANDMKKHEESLRFFKNALKADPGNEDARYNYELLKKLLQEQQENQQQQQNQEQQQQDQQQQEQQQDQGQQDQEQQGQEQQDEEEQEGQGQEQEQAEQQQEQQEQQEQENEEEEQEGQPQPRNMEDMKISEEMAEKILEAMRNNEIQYLQQMKKKAQKPPDNSKPDW